MDSNNLVYEFPIEGGISRRLLKLALALGVSIAAGLSISIEEMSYAINQTVPKEISDIFNSIIGGNGINFNIMIFYISAFLLASNGTFSMINISNEIYRIEPNGLIRRRVKAV